MTPALGWRWAVVLAVMCAVSFVCGIVHERATQARRKKREAELEWDERMVYAPNRERFDRKANPHLKDSKPAPLWLRRRPTFHGPPGWGEDIPIKVWRKGEE